MKKLALSALCVLAMSAQAAVVTINFDDLAGGAAVGASYAAQGVTFSNATTAAVSLTGSTAPNVIWHSTSNIRPVPADPLRFSFSLDVSDVSIDALDAGENGVRIEAFDIGGALLGAYQFVGVLNGTPNVTPLQVVAAGIRRVDLFRVNNIGGDSGDGVVFDNLRFVTDAAAVPEPSSLALVALALSGAAALLRRRRAG